MKYSGRVLISKIDNATGKEIGIATIPNSGTVDLWRLLCGLLETGNTADIKIPTYIDMGYFYGGNKAVVMKNVKAAIEANISLPKNSTDPVKINDIDTYYQSIIGTSGSIIIDKSVLLQSDNNPILNLTAYFSYGSFSQRESDVFNDSIIITLKDNNINGNILALVDTGLNKYEIADNETHILKWQLSFQNKTT